MTPPPPLDREAHVIAVDDQVENLALLTELLSPHFTVHPLRDGEALLRYLEQDKPADLILLDVVMPGMGGYNACAHLQADPRFKDIPVVFLTAMNAPEDEEKGLSLGAMDFITKPFSPAVVLARVRNHLHLSRATRLIRQQNHWLEEKVAERTRELQDKNQELEARSALISATRDATIGAFCALAETRDNETGAHIRRTQNYVRHLALSLRARPRYAEVLGDNTVDLLFKSAPLHDVGKVGIPDHILLKPGKLTPEEFTVMKTHTTLGRDAIRQAESQLGEDSSSFLSCAREIAYGHHEWWDGSGYPEGLRGEAIPLSARLMAVADVYDALISKRVYKAALAHEQAVEIMALDRGTHFDPEILDTFLDQSQAFQAIAQRYQD